MPAFQVQLIPAPVEPKNIDFVAGEIWTEILDLASYYGGTICEELPNVPMTPKTKMLGDTAEISYPFDPSLPNANALRAVGSLLFAAHQDRMMDVVGMAGWGIDKPVDDLPVVLKAEAEALSKHESLLDLMQPGPIFVEQMRSFLRSGEAHLVQTVAWYVAATAEPPVEFVAQLFEACIAVHDPAATVQTRKALRILASRLQLDALMEAHSSSKDPVARVLALELLEGAVRRRRLPSAWRLGALYEALRLGGMASEVAAEKLASAVDKENPEQFRRACETLTEFLAGKVSQDPEISEEARNNAVLSLFNLVSNRPTVPQCVVDAFHAQKDAPEPIAWLARYGLQVIDGRPVERW